jgi:hypothetical protein
VDALQCAGGNGLEYIAASEGSGGQHRAVDGSHERLCLVFRRSLEFQGMLPDAFFESLANPFAQGQKVLLDFNAHFFGKTWQFGCQQRCNAERLALISNTALPVLNIGLESCQRVVNLLRQELCSLQEPLSMSFEHCNNQVRFCGKVMMNASLPNLDGFSDIGVAECRVAEIGDQGFGCLEDAICGFSLHVYETTD